MTRTNKADSVSSRMARLQNRLINYQEQAQEVNPPDVEALRQASRYEQMILERNRWRAWAANLEAEKEELQRRVGEVERRRVQEAEELEAKNRELEEENREWRRRIKEVNKNRRIILQIIFVSILIFFVNKILNFFEIL